MEYWILLEKCLVAFHGFTASNAAKIVNSYYKELKAAQLEEFATHEEAFYLACRLAGKVEREPTAEEVKIYRKLEIEVYGEYFKQNSPSRKACPLSPK